MTRREHSICGKDSQRITGDLLCKLLSNQSERVAACLFAIFPRSLLFAPGSWKAKGEVIEKRMRKLLVFTLLFSPLLFYTIHIHSSLLSLHSSELSVSTFITSTTPKQALSKSVSRVNRQLQHEIGSSSRTAASCYGIQLRIHIILLQRTRTYKQSWPLYFLELACLAHKGRSRVTNNS